MKRKDLDFYNVEVVIEIVNGGFILNYPTFENAGNADELSSVGQRREVFHTRAKLNKKLKEVVDNLTEK
jgi:hypothetical protein